MRHKYLFVKGLIICNFLLFFITNTQAQTDAASIQDDVTFQWIGNQTTRTDAANIKSFTVDGKVFDLFAVPSGYQLTQVGPQGHIRNAIKLNGNTPIGAGNSGPTPTSTVNGFGSANWNIKALAAFQDKNLNHYFTSSVNGRNLNYNYTTERTTDAQRQSLLYDPAIPSNEGAIVAITERNANNAYHIEVFGIPSTGGAEQYLGETFVHANGKTEWGFGGTGSGSGSGSNIGTPGAVTKPRVNSDYWLSDRVVENNGTIGIALFYLSEIAPIGSRITRVQLTAATTDHGDGKFFILQSYATDDTAETIWNTPVNGNVGDNDQVPTGSSFSYSGSNTSFVLNTNGTYTYTPSKDFTGTVTFEYQVCLPAPNNLTCDTATITITVKQGDSDNDGVSDDIDLDDDNDGIPDILESGGNNPDGDEDGDGIPNYKDTTDNGNTGDSSTTNYTDADGNGIPDVYDTDGDGIANHLDLDGDNDGIADIVEAGGVDTNGDGVIDYPTYGDPTSMVDADNDGLADIYDDNVTGGTNGTPIANPDSDGDGISDAQDLDSDNDGIPDVVEAGGIDANGDGRIHATTDNDNDGFADSVDGDVNGTTDDTKALIITGEDGNNDGIPDSYPNGDTDGDGFLDSKDLDADNDGIPDLIEAGGVDTNGDGRVDEDTDTDNDGLADIYDTNASDGPGTNGTNGNALVKTDETGTMVDGNNNTIDTDGDGIPNHLDLDSDNDGIVDIIEAGGTDANRDGKVDNIDATGKLTTDTDNDGFDDVVDGNVNGTDNSGNALITTGTDTNTDGIADTYTKGNADTDNLPNFLDIDADNDGIPDNIEAQTTADYIAPSGVGTAMADENNNGIDDKYEVGTVGITPTNTDNTDNPDYLDSDSDNDGIADIAENGNENNSLSGIDTDGDGLDDNFEGSNKNDPYDVNDEIDTPNASNLGDEDSDLDSGGDVDYRDFKDNDGDGVSDFFDLDDDNDGILDTDEGCGNLIVNGDFELQDFSSTSEFPNGGTNSSGTFIGKTLNTNTLTGWNYTQNLDGWVGGQSPSWSTNTYANAYNGKQYIDVLGNNDKSDGGVSNILSQTFTTVPGNTYTLSFYWGEDIGHGTGQDVTLNVKVKDAGSSTIYDQTLKAKAEGTINGIVGPKKWYSFTTVFIATTTETSIEFQASPPVPGSIGIGAALDLVSVFSNNCEDTDNDGIPNSLDLDSDNDGIPDLVEAGGVDTDGNGIVDAINADGTLSNDTDGDGLDDTYDDYVVGGTNGNTITNPDSDGDGIPDTQDLDADNDGIPDVVEAGGTDVNGDGKADGFIDTDNDGFNDLVDGDVGQDGVSENTNNALIVTGNDANNDGKPDTYTSGDTDNDGIPNHLDLDADNDGIADVVEAGGTDVNGDGRADNFTDADNDGFNDVVDGDPTNALAVGTDTNGANTSDALIVTGADTDGDGNPDSYPNGDTDNDGIPNHLDLDADNDGIADVVEAGGTDANGDGRADNFVDADNDGFNDVVDGDPTNALPIGTDSNGANTDNVLIATGADTNGDGNPDSYPNGDTDSDGIPNHLDLDADNDGIADLVEAGGTDANGDGRADNFVDADNDGFNDVVDGDPTNALPVGTDSNGANTNDVLIATGTDTNGDGNPDSYPNGDTDNDGIPNHLDLDADNDGIADVVEAGGTDANGDGRADNFVDADNDGFNDVVDGDPTNALPVGTDSNGANTDNVLIATGADTNGDGNPDSYPNGDTDNDGIPNHLDLDADNDGIADVVEAGGTDANGDGRADNFTDADNDGFNDVVDGDPTNALAVGTDSNGTNTNNVLIATGADANGDGNPDSYPNGDTDNDGILNHLDLDADNDGIADVVEAGGTDANGDGRADNFVDADNDGFNDVVDGDPTNALAVGTDSNGSNTDNVLIATGTDTNGDGNPDTYPNGDTDNDGILNHLDLDADNDGIADVVEAGGTDANGDGRADNFVDADNDGFNDVVDGDPTNALAVGADSNGANTSDALIVTGADANGDGNPDSYPNGDTDNDGIPNHLDLDADNDGIADVVEAGGTDVNGDGRADNFTDADNDGFNDVVDGDPTNALVVGTDTNGANTSDALIATGVDADGDGNPDSYPNGDTDNDGILDHLDLDADNDGIADVVEAGGTDANGDGRADNFTDADNDGFNDVVDGDPTNVLAVGTDTNGANTGNVLIATGADANGDGNPDTYSNGDTDKDGILNHLDLDSDNDGITDVIEAGGADTDRDGLADSFVDTDNDGFNDTVDGDPTNALVVGVDTDGANTSDALILTSADDTNDGKPTSYTKGDADSDGFPNFLDIDADNDGIPDNVEGQSTSGYKAPTGVGSGASGITDANKNGVDDQYEDGANIGVSPINTDGDSGANYVPDYLDADSDNDGVLDIIENGDDDNTLSGTDEDNDGLDDNFDDNNDLTIAGSTVNDGLGSGDKVTDAASLESAFGDTDNDFPGTGDLDYRDKPDAANVMITQVYQFGAERWIEITNIGTTDIPANTIKIQLYKDKTGDQTGVTPDASDIVGTVLKAGKSVLFKKSTNSIISTSEIAADATVIINNDLTELDDANDIITLSSASGIYSWADRYDVVSNITNKTSLVRIDETLTTNTTYTPSEWVVFIDDAIIPYQQVGNTINFYDKRHPQDALISEIKESSTDANTLLGLHRINITTSTASNNVYTNGYPDRSRSVVIDQNFEHTSNRLSARKLKVNASKTLTVTDQLLVVTNDITLDGDIRLAGTLAQLVQTHTGTSTITSSVSGTMGNLLVDQNSEIPSLYRYGYMSSPVNSGVNNYTIEDVLKDGTDPSNPKDITFVGGYDGATTDPISLADHWIYTYAPGSDGRSNWVHQYKSGTIARGDGFIFKGPGRKQNYTFVGTPNDGDFSSTKSIAAGDSYLIGNPFPSAMNTMKFIQDNFAHTTGTLYFWEHHESILGEGSGIDGHIFGGYIGGYATINYVTGVAADKIADISINDNNGTSGLGSQTYKEPEPYIAIGQGFFIEGDKAGGAPIVFNNSQRAYVTEGDQSVFFKTSKKSSKTVSNNNLLPIIKVGFEYKNTEETLLHHQIAVSFQETNSFDFDKGYDSKVYGTANTDIYWKFPSDDNKYVIAGVQEISNELEVPLELTMENTGEVHLMVDQIQNVSRDIYITDKL
ncbi:hypothetical protein MPF19_18385, partial [Polaribacter sp. Z014]|nr:hypothetical protein [Polaribacter sp. Z014]